MSEKRELILKYRNDVVNGKKLTRSTTSELFNINNKLNNIRKEKINQ